MGTGLIIILALLAVGAAVVWALRRKPTPPPQVQIPTTKGKPDQAPSQTGAARPTTQTPVPKSSAPESQEATAPPASVPVEITPNPAPAAHAHIPTREPTTPAEAQTPIEPAPEPHQPAASRESTSAVQPHQAAEATPEPQQPAHVGPAAAVSADASTGIQHTAPTEPPTPPAASPAAPAQALATAQPEAKAPADLSGSPAPVASSTAPTAPGQYRPPRVAKPAAPTKENQKSKTTAQPKKVVRQQLLEVRLQALFDHYQYCTLRVLAARAKNSPPETKVECAGNAMELIESTDEWYEIAEQPPLGPLLSNGILMATQGRATQTTWELKGRPLYILAANHGLAGFVATTRLAIGREQVVLCQEGMANEVQSVLAASGCVDIVRHALDSGAPEGWVFFKPVKPAKSVQHLPGEEMLNLLRPLPDVELTLEGGLWLENSTWMAGFSPRVVVSGELPPHATVQIDGRLAEKQQDGTYHALACDAPGPHAVFCEGKTCSYNIVQPSVGWEAWNPLTFSRAAICGAQVSTKVPPGSHYIKAPTANPILIGQHPGEIFHCEHRPSGEWSGYVPFRPVWALPADPLHCNRETCRAILIAAAPPQGGNNPKPHNNRHHDSVARWCRAILDCRRKKLSISPQDDDTAHLWAKYMCQARNLARKLKHRES